VVYGKHITQTVEKWINHIMQNKETNKRNARGAAYGLWVYRWGNGKLANVYNYVDGRMFGFSGHYGLKEELITSFYYAR
jgi:hypothetical protein